MANATEIAESIVAVRETVKELVGPFESSKGQAEAFANLAAAAGLEDRVGQAKGIADRIGQHQGVLQGIEGGLGKAHWLMLSVAKGTIGSGAPGSGAIVPLARIDPDTGAPKAGLDAIPPQLRQDPTPTGEELTGVDPNLSPFQKEHEGANDDAGQPKSKRMARRYVRQAGDLAESAKQNAASHTIEIEDDFDPWGAEAQAIVEVQAGQPPVYVSRIDAESIKTGDLLSSALVIAAFTFEAVTRPMRKKEDG